MSAGISIIFHRFVALELRMCHDLEPRSLVKGQNAHSGFTTVWAMTGVYCYVCVALVKYIFKCKTLIPYCAPPYPLGHDLYKLEFPLYQEAFI